MNRSPMRRCGKPYPTAQAAAESKAAARPGMEVHGCRCGAWHVRKRPARRAVPVPRRVCGQVDRRDGRRCISCGASRGLHRHHRRGKGDGGDPRAHTDCACNLVTLCLACHERAHGTGRRAAETAGLIVSRAETCPWRCPVTVGGVPLWPTCDGRYTDELELAA